MRDGEDMATSVKSTTRIQRIRTRLESYYAAEQRILDGRAKAYAIGSRNLTRYDVQLADVRAQIDKLEEELADLDAGNRARASRAVVIRDW